MALRDVFKVSRRTFFNPGTWLNWDFLSYQNRFIRDAVKNVITVPTPGTAETFDEAMHRMNVSEADLMKSQRRFHQFTLIFVLCGLAVFLFSFYLLFRYWVLLDWLLGMAVTAVFLAQAFKYSFLGFQIHERKLGLTYPDWKKYMLGEQENKK